MVTYEDYVEAIRTIRKYKLQLVSEIALIDNLFNQTSINKDEIGAREKIFSHKDGSGYWNRRGRLTQGQVSDVLKLKLVDLTREEYLAEDEIQLDTRVFNAINILLGHNSTGDDIMMLDVVNLSRKELLQQRNFGENSLKALENWLNKYSLKLSDN